MKKIFTKKNALIFFGALFIMIITVIACKKMDELSNTSKNANKLNQFYSSSIIESLKKESIVQDFYQEMNKIPIKITNGILSFSSVQDVNAMYDLIIQYSDSFDVLVRSDSKYSKYAESDQIPADPIAYLFELKLGFNSLRMNIEEEILILERGNGIPDDNDPDDHYTVSPYMRALLSPDCEIIVDDLICVHYDEYAIGIMHYDWATLKDLHKTQKQNNFEINKAYEFCSVNPEAFVLTQGTEPTLSVAFTFHIDSKNPEEIQFINYSASEAYKEMEYFWDFGDGTTSTERNPKHAFKCKGQTDICLTVEIPHGNASKAQSTDCVTINFPITPNNNPEFSWYEGYDGTVYFNCTSPSSNEISKYIWKFADNTPEVTIYNNSSTNYKYTQNGSYNVKLTVEYHNSNQASSTKKITVKNAETTGNCCDGNERDVEKDKTYSYDGNNFRVKQVIRVTNAFWAHRLISKTKNQKKSAGAWYGAEADYINTGFNGTIYYPDSNPGCGTPHTENEWKDVDQTNTKKVVWDLRIGQQFNVSKNSMYSKHYVKHGGIVRISGNGPSIAPCN